MQKTILGLVRWLAILPGAALAAWLGWIFTSTLGRLSLERVGVDPDGLIMAAYLNTTGNALMGAALVYVGAKIAPRHGVKVAFALGGVALLASGASLLGAFLIRDWWAAWGALCIGWGAGLTVYSVHTGEAVLE